MAKNGECESGCGEGHEGDCPACRLDALLSFWCESCGRSVADKRCPYCGLKTLRKKA